MSTTTTTTDPLGIAAVLAQGERAENVFRRTFQHAPDSPESALAAMEKEAACGGEFFATAYLVAYIKTFDRALTGVADWITDAEPLQASLQGRLRGDVRPGASPAHTEMAPLDFLVSYADLVGRETAEQEARDVRAALERLDAALARARTLVRIGIEAGALVAHAGLVVARRIRVENACARVGAIRLELERLRDAFDGDGDLGALLAVFETRAGRRLPPVETVVWPAPKISEPSLRPTTGT